MARPKSMPDFNSLLDASYAPLAGINVKERPRKKPSISLAAGLIMASESPKTIPNTPRPSQAKNETEYSESLFYAYAQKSDYAQSPPDILTFASAAVADQWWHVVKTEYPESTRMGPQLFILKGEDIQEQIQDNPRFYDLRNKWFYALRNGMTSGAGVIPLQDCKGNPIVAPTATDPNPSKQDPEQQKSLPFGMTTLSETLAQMSTLISSNSSQIQALSVAQSSGLQRMQEINESTSTQIKALTDNQSGLQSLMDQNATHYIALSNSSFANQVQMKSVLQTNAEQICALANGQKQLAGTCANMMKTIEDLGKTIGTVSDIVRNLRVGDGVEVGSAVPFSVDGNRISPPPRKLNRRIKGVWYEYDTGSSTASPSRGSKAFLDTPTKSPSSSRT